VQRIPRSALQLVMAMLLSGFGTFWAVQGLGVAWPGGDAAIVGLVGWYLLVIGDDWTVAATVAVGQERADPHRLAHLGARNPFTDMPDAGLLALGVS
jgi:hypothetical protein